jgi:hypothetical protein
LSKNQRSSSEIKGSASKVTYKYLQKLKVSYKEEPMEMDEFFEMVKSKTRWTIRDTAQNTMDMFKKITKKQLEIDLDLDALTETETTKDNDHDTKSQKKEEMEQITASADEINTFFLKSVGKKEFRAPRLSR